MVFPDEKCCNYDSDDNNDENDNINNNNGDDCDENHNDDFADLHNCGKCTCTAVTLPSLYCKNC